MYILYVYIICIYYMYILYVYIICIYYIYVDKIAKIHYALHVMQIKEYDIMKVK